MEKIEIALEEYHWECGDGCCSEYGERLHVNGVNCGNVEFLSVGDVIDTVLKAIKENVDGYEDMDYEIEQYGYSYEDDYYY